MADELRELKDRLADLSHSVEELIARQRTRPSADPTPPSPEPPPPSPPSPPAKPEA